MLGVGDLSNKEVNRSVSGVFAPRGEGVEGVLDLSGFVSAPVGREEAARRGWSRYFTGVACVRGHVAERYVSDGSCVECRKGGASATIPESEVYVGGACGSCGEVRKWKFDRRWPGLAKKCVVCFPKNV